MDTKFLKDVQEAGWHIESVTEGEVIGRCRSIGCDLGAKLQPGAEIPKVSPGCRRSITDRRIETWDDARLMLRQRRESLFLAIKELEEIGGLATDHIAKMEKDDWSKQPSAQVLIEWAQALGYEVVFRPVDLTSLALRVVCDTRDKVGPRDKRFRLEGERRSNRAAGR